MNEEEILQEIDVLKVEMNEFAKEMYGVMFAHLSEKGLSWKKESTDEFLLNRLKRAVMMKNYVDVANYAFMLHDLQTKSKKK